MADGITITFEKREAEAMINRLLRRVKNPKKLVKTWEKYVHAVTMQMFRGRRPDTSGKRGVRWPNLAPKTVQQKAALRKRGRAIEIHRPLVRTGEMRDSLKVLKETNKGFVYGTRQKSKKGYNYPGIHNRGEGKIPQRKWLFLTDHDWRQIVKMTIDFLKGEIKSYRSYVEKK